MTINYDRVIEGEVFPHDLLGEKPVKESLSKTLKMLTRVKKDLGKVAVKYGQPIRLGDYIKAYQAKSGISQTAITSDSVQLATFTRSLSQ